MTFGGGSIAERAVVVKAPAIAFAGVGLPAGVEAARAYLAEEMATRNGHWSEAALGGTVAQLAPFIVTPAVGAVQGGFAAAVL
jgi:hypothetical protein